MSVRFHLGNNHVELDGVEYKTRADPGFFKRVAGAFGLQNEWGVPQECCNLRIGT